MHPLLPHRGCPSSCAHPSWHTSTSPNEAVSCVTVHLATAHHKRGWLLCHCTSPSEAGSCHCTSPKNLPSGRNATKSDCYAPLMALGLNDDGDNGDDGDALSPNDDSDDGDALSLNDDGDDGDSLSLNDGDDGDALSLNDDGDDGDDGDALSLNDDGAQGVLLLCPKPEWHACNQPITHAFVAVDAATILIHSPLCPSHNCHGFLGCCRGGNLAAIQEALPPANYAMEEEKRSKEEAAAARPSSRDAAPKPAASAQAARPAGAGGSAAAAAPGGMGGRHPAVAGLAAKHPAPPSVAAGAGARPGVCMCASACACAAGLCASAAGLSLFYHSYEDCTVVPAPLLLLQSFALTLEDPGPKCSVSHMKWAILFCRHIWGKAWHECSLLLARIVHFWLSPFHGV
eukprot:1152536-Pelagomonas_calceolata.AAC.4